MGKEFQRQGGGHQPPRRQQRQHQHQPSPRHEPRPAHQPPRHAPIALEDIVPEETPANGFKTFRLPQVIERGLAAMQFHTPTPIQSKAIPIALTGRDLIGVAQTGTGKTAAFCIPILTRLLEDKEKSALVLAPTRELAMQIEAFWKNLTQGNAQYGSALILGGCSMQPQVRALSRRPRLIVATPGRLVDHLRRHTAKLSSVAFLVLDEADRMLDMGFAPQLSEILKHLPRERQTLFFTATWANELDKLAARYLRDPERVTAGTISRAAPQISQALIMTTTGNKNDTLLDELNKREGSILVFTRTKSRTDRVARYLASYGVEVSRIHGGRSQGQRNLALAKFKSGEIRVLVATDIAARGIDVKDVGHVVNYDLPQSSDDYIHRIGRTGRAGASGQALSLVTPEDRAQWREIARLLERTGSQVPQMPSGPTKAPSPGQPTAPARAAAPAHDRGGQRGNRGGHSGERGGHASGQGAQVGSWGGRSHRRRRR